MPERIPITIDDKCLEVAPGCTVAAAVALAGGLTCRRSVLGQSRGPLCGMGVCFECRLTVDGQRHCRGCQLLCRPGMRILTDFAAPPLLGANVRPDKPCREQKFDVLIVGAGPAGLAAACSAAKSGCRVGVVDDNPNPGGQIWRGDQAQPSTKEAVSWFERVRNSPFEVLASTQVVGAAGPARLLAEAADEVRLLSFQKLILACGGRERFLPFPGWTLPGVFGAGGLQAMVKSGMPITGRRVAVAGSGPLLLAVAGYLRKRGALVGLIAEQAPWSRLLRFGLGLLGTQPGKVFQALSLRRSLKGVPYRTGAWPVRATGDRQLTAVIFSDGRRAWTETCDYLACGFGLVPNLELASLLGCDIHSGVVAVDEMQQTSMPGIYCAGEMTGIGGLDKSLVEGQIAGYAAVDQLEKARGLWRFRDEAWRFAGKLERAFALRDELRRLAEADTVICRCEDVALGRLGGHDNRRAAKLHTRCGMGPCQGRVCGPITEFLFDWPLEPARLPIFPTELANLVS